MENSEVQQYVAEQKKNFKIIPTDTRKYLPGNWEIDENSGYIKESVKREQQQFPHGFGADSGGGGIDDRIRQRIRENARQPQPQQPTIRPVQESTRNKIRDLLRK